MEKTNGHAVSVNHKIVSQAGPFVHFGRQVQRGNHSDFVDMSFKASLTALGLSSNRLRSDLKGTALVGMKKILKGLTLVSAGRGDAYKIKVWTTALRATKTTYQDKCFTLYWKTLAHGAKRQAAKTQYSHWISQL